MKVIYSPYHILHDPPKEFISNHIENYGESPFRAELIFEALMDLPGIEVIRPVEFSIDHLLKVHSEVYIKYLETAYDDWIEAGLWSEGVLPEFFALGRIRQNSPGKSPVGKAGYYMTDSCTMIVKGTWEAVRHSAYTALTGAQNLLNGDAVVISLCRPPGHHAGYDYSGGYCFLNNATIAARYLIDVGSAATFSQKKVAILDIDFHHGNGTQDVVQRQENILFVSIHGDPDYNYPYLTGSVAENSEKNINYPLPTGTTDKEYESVFQRAVTDIKKFGVDYLIVSLGVDTFEFDQLGDFKLTSPEYSRLSEILITELEIPILVIMEGGYNTDYLAANVLSFLKPFMPDPA